MSRWARARDDNDTPIAKALRDAGAFVEKMGDWDLTVKYPFDREVITVGNWYFIEVKNPEGKGTKRRRKLKPGQSEWHKNALTARQKRLIERGFPLIVVSSIAEALAAIGAPAAERKE